MMTMMAIKIGDELGPNGIIICFLLEPYKSGKKWRQNIIRPAKALVLLLRTIMFNRNDSKKYNSYHLLKTKIAFEHFFFFYFKINIDY